MARAQPSGPRDAGNPAVGPAVNSGISGTEARIAKLEELYISQGMANDTALTKLAARIHKLEQTHMARDDQELANYTRQVTAIDAKVNGMEDNIRAYDRRIVEAEAKVENAPLEVIDRLARRVHRLEAQARYTGAYDDAVASYLQAQQQHPELIHRR